MLFDECLGIMLGTLVSGLTGYLMLRYSLPNGKIKAGSELHHP
jgi:hypothetical protein